MPAIAFERCVPGRLRLPNRERDDMGAGLNMALPMPLIEPGATLWAHPPASKSARDRLRDGFEEAGE